MKKKRKKAMGKKSNEFRYDFQDWKPFSTLVLNNILVLCTDLLFLPREV